MSTRTLHINDTSNNRTAVRRLHRDGRRSLERLATPVQDVPNTADGGALPAWPPTARARALQALQDIARKAADPSDGTEAYLAVLAAMEGMAGEIEEATRRGFVAGRAMRGKR